MIAELKEIYSLDVDCGLDEFYPDAYDYFELSIILMIGPSGEEGSEKFELQVCTPKWLQGRCEEGGVVLGRHNLIVGEFDFQKIRSYIDSLCKRCSGKDWQEIAGKLSRYAQWEFEDYQQYTA